MPSSQDYHYRHYGVNRLYVGVDKQGRSQHVLAQTKKEAVQELRRMGFRPIRVIRS